MEGAPSKSPDPRSVTRRSPIYRSLAAAGARFKLVDDAAIASSFVKTGEEHTALRVLGLADLSPLPRTGFKGRATTLWLARQGLAIGDASNRAYPCGRNSLAVRLAPTEVLVLGGRDGDAEICRRLESAWSVEAGMVFPVPRRDGTFWFSISGEYAPAMFAKLCGVDLRPDRFANRAVAQTSVARIGAVVVRDDIEGVLCYHLLGDVASAGSMWTCLTDAMAEFDGRLVGIDSLSLLTNVTAR